MKKIVKRIICAVVGHGVSYQTSLSRKLYRKDGRGFVHDGYMRHECTRCEQKYIVEEKN